MFRLIKNIFQWFAKTNPKYVSSGARLIQLFPEVDPTDHQGQGALISRTQNILSDITSMSLHLMSICWPSPWAS